MKPSYCVNCGAAIIFLPSKKAMVPVDASTVKPSDTKFNPDRHRNHMADCARRQSAKRQKVRAAQSRLENGDPL